MHSANTGSVPLHGKVDVPAVKGDLTDVEPFAQSADELLNISVMHHIALRGATAPADVVAFGWHAFILAFCPG